MKCILVYASMTGNTEMMSEAIAEGVKASGIELDSKPMDLATAAELKNYEGILLGAYTWGDGDLPDEAAEFFKELDEVSLTGRLAAAFGSCDSNYVDYGAAVDLLEKKLRARGAEIAESGLKVDRMPKSSDLALCKQFGKTFAAKLLA